MKFACADIRSRYTEPTVATPRSPIQTPKKPTAFGVSAKHSKSEKLLTPVSSAGKAKALDTVAFAPERLRARLGEQSGDLQGLSSVECADSESVDELLEEGNAFEAKVVKSLEDAEDGDEGKFGGMSPMSRRVSAAPSILQTESNHERATRFASFSIGFAAQHNSILGTGESATHSFTTLDPGHTLHACLLTPWREHWLR